MIIHNLMCVKWTYNLSMHIKCTHCICNCNCKHKCNWNDHQLKAVNTNMSLVCLEHLFWNISKLIIPICEHDRCAVHRKECNKLSIQKVQYITKNSPVTNKQELLNLISLHKMTKLFYKTVVDKNVLYVSETHVFVRWGEKRVKNSLPMYYVTHFCLFCKHYLL